MSRLPFPLAIDSSIMTSFKACPKQAWFSHIRRVKPAGQSIHLVAGAAFAKALEVARNLWYEQGVRDQQHIYCEALRALWLAYDPNLIVPDRHRAKGPEVLAEGLVKYLDRFNFAYDIIQPAQLGRRAIEFNFAIDLPILHPGTGDPILWAGKLDMVADTGEGLFVLDDKTTGSYGPSWSDNWRMRYQFLGYTWAARESGFDVAGVIIRGMLLTLARIDVVNDIKLFAPWKIDRWHHQMLIDVQAMVDAWKNNQWGYDFSESCTSYGGCEFVEACDCKDHEAALGDTERWVPNTWSPLVQIEQEAA